MLTYWKHLLQSFSASHRLSRRLLTYILACSTLLAVISTLFQLGWDYRQSLFETQARFQEIESTHLNAIAASVWNMDNEQLNLQLKGLYQLPNMQSATVYEQIDTHLLERMHVGKPSQSHVLTKHFPLIFEDYVVGELEVTLTLEPLYRRLWQNGLLILAVQVINTLVVSCFILLILYHQLIRHLHKITHFLQHLNVNATTQHPIILARQEPSAGDELGAIVTTINEMQRRHASDWQAQQSFADNLQKEHTINKELNEQLEQMVASRTQSLETSHHELQIAYDNLKNTQQALIESEKMASLGALVAGMANELNVPLGISVTANRFLSGHLTAFAASLPTEATSPNSWQAQVVALQESADLIQQQTRKAQDLLNNFQQIAITHSSQQTTTFNVVEVLHQIIISQGHRLNQQQCHIAIECDPTLEVHNYLSAFNRVCSHLIQNSLDHAFEYCNRPRKITIQVQHELDLIRLDYHDNGQGIDPELLPHIFEPFVTNRREQGFSGLGGYIIYNQVVQLLKGKIKCQSSAGNGVHFSIEMPKLL